jgi:MinD superfamily P-loop ATPase
MVHELRIPFGVVVNRMGIGDNRIHSYCETENIPILQEIPDDRRIAETYSRGNVIVETLPEYRKAFESILEKIMGLHEVARR